MASRVKLDKLRKQLEDLPRKVLLKANREVAKTIREKMLDLIKKGVSPIEGAGRFQEYKAVTANRPAKEKLKLAKSLLRKSKNNKVRIEKKIERIKKGITVGYPESVRKDFPQKRNRPVNLFLSGRFLKELEARVVQVDKIKIGFFKSYGQKLEQGHREGANGQPERPIIPLQNSEEFAKSIVFSTIKVVEDAIKDYLKKLR